MKTNRILRDARLFVETFDLEVRGTFLYIENSRPSGSNNFGTAFAYSLNDSFRMSHVRVIHNSSDR